MNKALWRPIKTLAILVLTTAATKPPLANAKNMTPTIYQFDAKDINGKETTLKNYQGKVLLVVNTASQCGFTPQYKGLEAVFKKFKDRGFFVLGFPSNDFGQQEPGTNKEIKNFCELNYKVSFPLFAKQVVSGPQKSALFKFLTEESGTEFKRPIDWNFEKFLISRSGRVAARFKSSVDPESPEITAAIEKELRAKSN